MSKYITYIASLLSVIFVLSACGEKAETKELQNQKAAESKRNPNIIKFDVNPEPKASDYIGKK